ncbi:DUF4439 domain-containing protein [Myceligenerans salitolerans]|uniref:DUF4439 domain-containing protein n=1 Tax=Myceligenerans salitolerans TaxID=1230528 RepID=A0ABS3IAN5_9MICO|nr:DUF4439 domain-containing protein [Myceligenerans salitolerans]MBO0610050.1 DUF4439 domain-containing protein [Myceligenerans salitolerans]
MNPNPAAPTRRTARSRRRAAIGLACALLLSGCGVRFDAPPPTEPVPDPVEIVRRTAVDDALHVAEQAEAVAARRDTRPRVAETLTGIAEISRQHAGQLGGEYESGLESEPSSPAPSEAPDATGPGAVLTTLTDAAARSATAADVCEDGPLARLLASISAAQTLAARDLAGAAGRKQPAYAPPAVPGTEDSGQATASAPPDDAGTGESDTTTAALTPSARPTTAPGGLAEADLAAIVLAEDSTAYALEVRAAQADDEDVSERLTDRAETHRRRAEGWARVAGVDDTGSDPRRAAYELPSPAVTSPDVVLEAEGKLAAGYASMVGRAEADTRAVVVALLADSALAQRSWGAPTAPFPGLPEQAGD